RGGDIVDALVNIEALHEVERPLPVLLRIAEVDVRLHAPEQVRRERDESLLGVVLAHQAHVLVDAENLLLDDQPRALARARQAQITAERAAVGGPDVDVGPGHEGLLCSWGILLSPAKHARVSPYFRRARAGVTSASSCSSGRSRRPFGGGIADNPDIVGRGAFLVAHGGHDHGSGEELAVAALLHEAAAPAAGARHGAPDLLV